MCRFSRSLLVLAGAFFLLVIGTVGCSRQKEQPPKEKAAVPAEQATNVESREADTTGSEPHQVTPCKTHRYYIAPGESATVTFETEVKSDTAKAAKEGEPKVNKEAMEAAGYSVSYGSQSVDTFTRSSPVWTVYSPEFTAKEGGVVGTSSDGVLIRWAPDGTGVIEGVRNVHGRFEVGKLTKEDLAKKLGSDSVRVSTGPESKTYNLSPSQGSMDQEINILSVTLNVTVPRDTTKIMQDKIGGLFWKGGGISFRGYYNNIPKVQKYVIAGPAIGRECFDQ